MANIFISLAMVILLATCGLMTIIILMQKPSANAGMGASLGGGAAESVFGGETASVLLKYTVRVAVAFFLLSFLLYIGFVAHHRTAVSAGASVPTFGLTPDKPSATTPAPAIPAKATTPAVDAAKTPAPAPMAASTPAAASSASAPAK